VARGLMKAVHRARRLIYIENQYLWSREVVGAFCQALQAEPALLLMAVVPRYPDQDGRFSTAPNLVGLEDAMRMLVAAGGSRVAIYGLENQAGTPVYVHAKACVVDDEWAKVGSDNLNRRSWTHDSELSCAIVDEMNGAEPGPHVWTFARDLRLVLAREHLDRDGTDDSDLYDPTSCFAAFATSAARLDAWHADGRAGPRPAGRLRTRPIPELSRRVRVWSSPIYRVLYDPDGRPRRLRREGRF
jgi:phosphatidylserine/phosphatidylglycerophosphate/cardiolipin synthase-like enzyme